MLMVCWLAYLYIIISKIVAAMELIEAIRYGGRTAAVGIIIR